MTTDPEIFGSPERAAVARRSLALWRLLSDDPRFAWYGRLVAISEPGPDAADLLMAMARLQGAGLAYFFPGDGIDALDRELRAQGFGTDRFDHFQGGASAIDASRALLARAALPGDLRVETIGPSSPRALLEAVVDLQQSCEVMPVPGAVMRGQARTGVVLVALDAAGRPVSTASSFVIHHPASAHAADVFWGMLATRPDRRGEGIARLLGAQAIVHMWERHGARGFMTGVRAENRSSRVLCEQLGVTATPWTYALAIDHDQFSGGKITR